MTFELPKLPYNASALEPFISAKTIEFHYGKHHQTYVTKLNGLLPGSAFENATLEEIIQKAEGPIFNNGAQVWNHTFFWEGFSARRGTSPSGKLLQLIEQQFGSFDEFKTKFADAAVNLFGSGWAWLVLKADGSLAIVQTGNAGNPLRDGHKPLLTCDVWEHAYYLDYQNRRPDFLAAFWNLVDWDLIAARLG
ncbi:MAG TPA: superoxide dismutase [Bacteroidales bacterium]|nr:superoxide dismutase [Bacteroidales bacterium]